MKVAIDGAGFTPATRRRAAQGNGDVQIHRTASAQFKDELIAGMARERDQPRIRRAAGQADRGLRLLRLSRKPRRQLRQDRLRLILDEVPPSGRLLRRPAQCPADGLLRARPDRPRRARAWGRDPARSCVNDSEWDTRLVRRSPRRNRFRRKDSAAPPRPARSFTGLRWRRCRAHPRSHAQRRALRIGRGPMAPLGCRRSPRSRSSPRRTRSTRSGSIGARHCGRSAVWARRRCRCSKRPSGREASRGRARTR